MPLSSDSGNGGLQQVPLIAVSAVWIPSCSHPSRRRKPASAINDVLRRPSGMGAAGPPPRGRAALRGLSLVSCAAGSSATSASRLIGAGASASSQSALTIRLDRPGASRFTFHVPAIRVRRLAFVTA